MFNFSDTLLEKSKSTLDKLPENDLMSTLEIGSILRFVSHAERQIEQLYRRIILKESIPHNEKVFSVFKEYTEWLCKGKAGVPVELGLKAGRLHEMYNYKIFYHKCINSLVKFNNGLLRADIFYLF